MNLGRMTQNQWHYYKMLKIYLDFLINGRLRKKVYLNCISSWITERAISYFKPVSGSLTYEICSKAKTSRFVPETKSINNHLIQINCGRELFKANDYLEDHDIRRRQNTDQPLTLKLSSHKDEEMRSIATIIWINNFSKADKKTLELLLLVAEVFLTWYTVDLAKNLSTHKRSFLSWTLNFILKTSFEF